VWYLRAARDLREHQPCLSQYSASNAASALSTMSKITSIGPTAVDAMMSQPNRTSTTGTCTRSSSTIASGSSGSADRRAHWRSSGWTPLAYPSSAIIATDHLQLDGATGSKGSCMNKHFPLHRDVILAVARELLILDGSIHKKTLEVIAGKSETAKIKYGKNVSKKQKPWVYLRHIDSEGSAAAETAEDLAERILERAVEQNGSPKNTEHDKRPRKVSDTDIVSFSTATAKTRSNTLLPAQLVLVSNGYHVSVPNTSTDGSMSQLPPLLEISISTETHLRGNAYEMTSKLTSTFGERPLREFLGYMSNTPKRDRIVEVMADLLFDVSHAMFAWEQTETEMSIELSDGRCDRRICSDLFDCRALKRIGGFDPWSLLPHALSISRARINNVSWQAFAASEQGRTMLHHHREGCAAMAGQKRRRQRPRSRNGSQYKEGDSDDKRSRSLSVISTSDESADAFGVNEMKDVDQKGASTFNIVPDVIPLTIKREKGMAWGISLAKEGSMCIVDRVPADEVVNDGLKIGDMIVSIRNERNQSVSLPSARRLPPVPPTLLGDVAAHTQKFYRQAVDLFKISDILHLEVRRVGA